MERSHLYGVIKKEIIRTLRRLKSVSGSDYTRLAQREGFVRSGTAATEQRSLRVAPIASRHFDDPFLEAR